MGLPRTRAPALALFVIALVGCGKNVERGVTDGGMGDLRFIPAKHAAPPMLENGGAALKPLRLVTVVAQNDDLGGQLTSFSDALVKSSWWSTIGGDYGLGAANQTTVALTGPAMAPKAVMDQATMENYVTAAIQAAPIPPNPDGHTLYLLYLPQTVSFLHDALPNTNCNDVWGGYHVAWGDMGDGLAIMMRCPPRRGETQIDQLTLEASHEIAEAASDPRGKGWGLSLTSTGDAGMQPWEASVWVEAEGSGRVEIADLCSVDTRVAEAGNTYQRIFSTSAALRSGDPCVPPLTTPYFNVAASGDWFAGTTGQSVTIPLTGWSTAPVDEWIIKVVPGPAGDPVYTANALVDSPTSATIGNTTYKTINNGRTASLRVNLPPQAQSGFWQVFYIRSFHLDLQSNTPAGEDFAHRALVGVYIP